MAPHPEFVLQKDRRNYFRITINMPVIIQLEGEREGHLTQQLVNLSGGGIGFLTNTVYPPGEILMVALQLPDQYLFKGRVEVLRHDPLPHKAHTYRVHARFINLSEQERQVLIRYIMRFQREHLIEHYCA
jgi:c-di-GMP-binding flagellar brake protein YcgR